MTEDNKKKNIREEMELAARILDEAALLFENGFLTGAFSRLYYFVLHGIRALLLTEGFQPKSHQGTLRLFSLHFVKKGAFEPAVARVFARLMKYREEADYNPSSRFTREDFLECKKEAVQLSDQIRAHLKDRGYMEG